MTKTTRLFAFSLALLVALASGAAPLAARTRLAVNAVNSVVTQEGAIATAKFKIQIVNQDDVALTAMRVVFAGDIEVVIGDVAAESTVLSGGQQFMFDTTNMPPTKSFPVPVTVKFLVNGVETEMAAILAMKRAE